jgi:ATP-dependent RNA helicase DBP3
VITVEGEDSGFRPVEEFSELTFDEDLMSVTKVFAKPTPIQSQCWPIILADRDIIGIAKTGSGKTLAFSLPILYHIKHGQRSKKPLMLVLAPTRELAKQTADVCEAAGADSKIKVCSVSLYCCTWV